MCTQLWDSPYGEEAYSSYIYPPSYTGPKPIIEQVNELAQLFSLPLDDTIDYIENVLPTVDLPEGAEGWFALPSVTSLATIRFPEIQAPAERYGRAVNFMLAKFGASRALRAFFPGENPAKRLRPHAHTMRMFEQLAEQQRGSILIVPGQFGLRHRNRSIRRARECYLDNEFSLGIFAVGCMLLNHPERLGTAKELWIYCCGDEIVQGDDDGLPIGVACFYFHDGKVELDTLVNDFPREYFGSASGFVPKQR